MVLAAGASGSVVRLKGVTVVPAARASGLVVEVMGVQWSLRWE